jgi:hypothetical protein
MPAHAQSASILSNSSQKKLISSNKASKDFYLKKPAIKRLPENASFHVGPRSSTTAKRKFALTAQKTAKTAPLSTLAQYAAINSSWRMVNANRVRRVTMSIRQIISVHPVPQTA